MAHKIVTDVAHSIENPRLGPATERPEQDAAIAERSNAPSMAGQESVKRGPELLAALREAGVVDAGGYGLTIIFAGVVAALRGDDPPELDHYAAGAHQPSRAQLGHLSLLHELRRHGQRPEPGRFIAPLEQLGDSVLVVGDDDDPEGAPAHRRARAGHGHVRRRRARSRGWTSPTCACRSPSATSASTGPPSRGARAPRRPPAAPRSEGLAPQPGAAGAALRGGRGGQRRRAGARCSASSACTRSTAARRSTPRPTTCLRESTRCRPRRWSCCTNSANVIMAAEHAAKLSDKQVLVAPTTSQQAGLAAAVALLPDRPVEENARALTRGARAGAHRRRRARGSRRRPGALQTRRGGGIRGGGGARLGRPGRDAAGGAEDAGGWFERVGRARADQRPRRRGRAAGARRARGDGQRRVGGESSSSCATAASPPTGGCSTAE